MKFIHTADIHLDSPLRGLAAYPDAPAERLRTATRDAFQNRVGRAIDEAVDFMVIAGDVYDGDWKDFNTGLFFVRQMGRLRQAGIPVYLLHGNHDADSEMTRSLQLPDNVHTFPSRKVETFRIEDLKVALHGRSFKVAATTDNLLPGYPAPVPGWFNIGVLHTALEGSAEHARYAPCSVAELDARGYAYWALGHVHERWVRSGPVTIAYPGNLQGRHIRECGPRGALMVTVEEGEVVALDHLEVDVLRWHALEVDVTTADTLADAVRLAGKAIERQLDAAGSELPLAVRITLRGETVAHTELLGQPVQLRQELIAQAVALDPDRVWIEKVLLATRAPQSATTVGVADGEAADALGELALIARSVATDSGFLDALQQEVQLLLERVPHEVLQAVPELKDLRQDPQPRLVVQMEQAVDVLIARLQGAPESASARDA